MGKIGTIVFIGDGPEGKMEVTSDGKVYTLPRIGCEEHGGRIGCKVGDEIIFEAEADNIISTFRICSRLIIA